MLKKIHHLILLGALALAPAPAATAYQEVCFNLKRAGYTAAFKWAEGHRDNRNGLDTHWNGRNVRDGVAIGKIHAHQGGCYDLGRAGVGPGDRLRFYVSAHGGNTVECGPADGDRNHPGFWLVPDGPAEGRLVFEEDGGTTLRHSCKRSRSSDLRMHSECNAGIEGMSNRGCEPWLPELGDGAMHDIVEDDLGLGMLGSVMRRGGEVDARSRDRNDNTALHIVAWKNRPEYGEHLIRAGANLNVRNRQGSTPVFVAAHYDSREALRQLLDAGANASSPNHAGQPPLHRAAERGDLEMVRMLVEAGAHIDAQHAVQETTSLQVAKERGHRAVVDFLLEANARDEIYDQIVYDIVARDLGAFRLRGVLSRGANVNHAGEGGKTALHLAAERDLLQYVTELLKDDDADRDALDDDGRTPLMLAMRANSANPRVVRKLLSGGSNPNIADESGDFPLYAAVRNGRLDMLQILAFVRNVDINKRHAETGLTAVGLAGQLRSEAGGSGSGFDRIARFLARRGGAE